MPIYSYKAIGPGGEIKVGVIDADTPRDARTRLRRDKLLVSEIREAKTSREKVRGPVEAGRLKRVMRKYRSRGGMSGRDLDFVTGSTRQLGTMLGSGIPLAEAVRAMIEQAQDRRTETIFREIRERINSGGSLADALEEHPHLFSDLYVGMVRAGEATGNVDVVLTRLADYLQYQRTLRRKVVGALTYPLMMILLGVGVVTALMAWVVPNITSMLEDTGQTLPGPTRVLVAISDLFKNWWWAGMLLVAATSFALERIYKGSHKGRLVLDRFMLRVPIVGDVLLKQSVSRFSRTLSTLLQSGVPVVQSLEITRNVIPNRVLADATDMIRTRILEGADIATPLRASGVFPAVVGYMVAVGEQAGELEQMLDRISSAYDEEIEIATDRMTSVLEPILILALAVVVGFIVVSIVLPILQVGNVG
jgi:general secretion pathway protein F